MSVKFHTFAYNSRTVKYSYMKFGHQFKINKMSVCTKCRGNRLRDFGLFAPKCRDNRLRLKMAEVRQNIFHMVILVMIPFYLYEPTFSRDEFLSFVFCFPF